MSKNEVKYYPSANWASVSGNFTPEELRAIAEKIEHDFKDIDKKGA